jgi:excisionase family DNA binding protein
MTTSRTEEMDWSKKSVFSTGEAALVCRVSQQTIIRCFDSGKLQGFRVPGSKFRRIPRDELIRFMRENRIPVSAIEGTVRRVLSVHGSGSAVGRLGAACREHGRVELCEAHTGFDAGWRLARFRPHLILLEHGFSSCTPEDLRSRLGELEPATPTVIAEVVVGPSGGVERDAGVSDFRVVLGDEADAVASELLGLLVEDDDGGAGAG